MDQDDFQDVSESLRPTFDNVGCALVTASGLVALLLSLYLAASLGAIFAFPFAFPIIFLVTLLIATLIGIPLLLLAIGLRRANLLSAILAGFVTGAAVPAIPFLTGGRPDWTALLLYGGAGLVGGIIFWRLLTAPRRVRWD